MRYKLILSLLVLSGCGFNGTQRVEVVTSGQVNFVIDVKAIQQFIDLCKESLLPESYSSTELYNQAVAQCVLNSTKSLSPSNLPVCQPNANLSGFTSDQLAAVEALCGH